MPVVRLAAPLKWGENHEENFQNLLETSYANTVALVPEIAHVRYDFEHRHFVDGSGKIVTDERFEELADKGGLSLLARGLGSIVTRGASREGVAYARSPAGSSTLKSAALYRSLVRGGGEEVSGRQILDQVGQQLRGRGLDKSLRGIRYSTAPEKPEQASGISLPEKHSDKRYSISSKEVPANIDQSGENKQGFVNKT